MSNEMREATNKVELVGVVKEHKLKSGKGDNGNYINGSLTIKTGEFSELDLKVFVNEKNKEGKTKKAYTTLKSILDGEHKTMVNESEDDKAIKVRVNGNGSFCPKIKEEIYKPEGSPDVKTSISIDLGFGNITIDNNIKVEEYKANFDIEMLVAKIEEEVKDDEETGRVLIKGYVPVYGGQVFPVSLVAGKVIDEEGEYDFAEDIRTGVEEGQTIDFWGEINYKQMIEKVKKSGIGRAKIEEKRKYVRELVTIGAAPQEDPEKEFDVELIKKAITERDIRIEEKKNQESKGKVKGRGLINKSSSSKSASTKPSIPF